MRHEDIWDEAAAAVYDTPGEGMFEATLLKATVDRLADLAAGGRALEFAIGTGRVAIPLSERGVQVAGNEIAPAMAAKLREKVGDTIPVVIGDMTRVVIPGPFSLVFLVFNGISNVLTQEEQIECFRNAARHLGDGGRFVIELWVPRPPPPPAAVQAIVIRAEPNYVAVGVYDTVQQQTVSHHFRFGEGTEATVFRSPHRYVWPAELDMMAGLAGFELEARHADWSQAPFTPDSRSHVSVYRKVA